MSAAIDRLEDRVNAVAMLVRHLRREVTRLEVELTERPAAEPDPATSPAVPPDDRLLGEVARLRQERAAVRERIRELIREIDQVPW